MTPIIPALVAPSAGSLQDLVAAAKGCTACPELAASRQQVVPGVFPDGAEILLVGEAPGADEDAAGVPFVGRSGQLLDRLLSEAGLDRAQVAVANVLKCRPPRNRTPRRGEVATCRPWLDRQLDMVDPLVVVTLGTTALAWALGPKARIGEVRGSEQFVAGRPLVATYHPSAALRFGPNGAPMTALRADLVRVAGIVIRGRAGRTTPGAVT